MKKEVLIAYLGLIMIIFMIFITHAFKIFSLQVDKYTFFLTSLLFVLLILPAVKTIKFFDLIEVRREYKALRKQLKK